MNIKKIIYLGIFLAALLSYIYFFELEENNSNPNQRVLKGYSIDQIQTINIASKAEKFSLNKIDIDKWKLDSNPGAIINERKVRDLIKTLLNFEYGEDLGARSETLEPGSIGLEPAILELVVSGQGWSKQISFGELNEYTTTRYAKIGQAQSIYLVSNSLYLMANVSSDYFRERNLIQFYDNEVSEIKISGIANLSLKKAGEEWDIDSPVKAKASKEAVSKLTNMIREIKADGFLDGTAMKNNSNFIEITNSETGKKKKIFFENADENDNSFLSYFRLENSDELYGHPK